MRCNNCNTVIEYNSRFCGSCGDKISTNIESNNKLNGLRGWLILVGIGIIFAPIRLIAMIFPIYSQIFSNGTWEILTTEGTNAYNSLWAPILLGEIGINILLIFTWLFIAFLFFMKKKIFPKVYISVLIFTFVFIILDAFAIKMVLPNEAVFDKDTLKEMARSIIGMAIWIPYMLISKRVKATFIK